MARAVERAWIFGYGSLLCPESIARTIERRVDEADYRPARIHGFRKAWGARHRSLNCVTPEWKPVAAENLCALYLQRDAEAICNGGVLEVSAEEFARLDLRERHYERIRLKRIEVRAEDGQWRTFDEPVFTYYPRHPAETTEVIDSGEVQTSARYFNRASHGLRRLGLEDDTPPIRTLSCFDVDVEFGQHWTLRDDEHLKAAHRKVLERHAALVRYGEQIAAKLIPPGSPPAANVSRLLRPMVLSHALLDRVASIAESLASAAGFESGWVDLAIWRPFMVLVGVSAGNDAGPHDLLADCQQWSAMMRDDPRHPPFPFRPARAHLAEQPRVRLTDEERTLLLREDHRRGRELPLIFAPILRNGCIERRSLPAMVRAHVHGGRCFDLHVHAGDTPEECGGARALRAPVFTTPVGA